MKKSVLDVRLDKIEMIEEVMKLFMISQ